MMEYGLIVAIISGALIVSLSSESDELVDNLLWTFEAASYGMQKSATLVGLHDFYDENGDGEISEAEGMDELHVDACAGCPTEAQFNVAFEANDDDDSLGLDEDEWATFVDDWLVIDPNVYGHQF